VAVWQLRQRGLISTEYTSFHAARPSAFAPPRHATDALAASPSTQTMTALPVIHW